MGAPEENQKLVVLPRSCRMRIISTVSTVLAIVSLVLIWVGSEIMTLNNPYANKCKRQERFCDETDDFTKEGIMVGVLLIVPALWILVAHVLTAISVRMKEAKYGVTVVAIIFSSINLVGAIAVFGVFVGVAGHPNLDVYGEPIDLKYRTGAKVLFSGGIILTIAEILCIIVASYETKRVVRKPRTKTIQKIVITNDPTTGHPVPQIMTEQMLMEAPIEIEYNPTQDRVRRNQIGTIVTTMVLFGGMVMIWVGTFLADQPKDNSIGYWNVLVLIFPTVVVFIPILFLLLSVYRERTHCGFCVTSLVFASVIVLGAITCVITFAFMSHGSKPYSITHDYGRFGVFTEERGSEGQVRGFAIVSAGSALVMLGQILIIVFSSLEIKRVPRAAKKVLQSNFFYNGKPVPNFGTMAPPTGQQFVYYVNQGQVVQNPAMFAYPAEQAPAYPA